jgi:hypothetical protein
VQAEVTQVWSGAIVAMKNSPTLVPLGVFSASAGDVDSEDERQYAMNEHNKISSRYHQTKESWMNLARQVAEFMRRKLYRYIIDPETHHPFTRVDDWARSVFGKSPATVFADMEIIRELDGVVSDGELATMTKTNAKKLARRKKQNKLIDNTVVQAATTCTACEFEQRYGSDQEPQGTPSAVRCQLGPFQVSVETVDLFRKALAATGLWSASSGDDGQDDPAIAELARAYLALPHIPYALTGDQKFSPASAIVI